ncbi:MAG TPA: hypothetical protein PKL73_24115 [Polyangiaceae bacterium]|nr:MAG: hypothetical protein BWY17_00671 [Deltaproteobacteria bacterium ADurb.Bin207]HNT00067.1 hypothetical protein [Polyangiaceae bacterium]HNZ24458.1 hypothetical protein [Polyangiaceae bacterium]HOD25338.1 hypothetical protein [Polyangiaceae bacterium]HQF24672.1 hypothetical protein [Polyangiaceae bacterium]
MNMKRMLGIGFSVGLLWFVGCTPSKVRWEPRQPSPRPMERRAQSSVEIFDGQAPNRPNLEVGVLTAGQSRPKSDAAASQLKAKFIKRAAEIGCDAIVIRDASGAVSSKGGALEAGCLMWTEDAPAAVAGTPSGPNCTRDYDCQGEQVCNNGTCTEPAGATDPNGASERSGCKTDLDCKGDRICEDGKCTAPEKEPKQDGGT